MRNFGSVVQVGGHPALCSDLYGWIILIVPDICDRISAGEWGWIYHGDGPDKRIAALIYVGVRIGDGFGA